MWVACWIVGLKAELLLLFRHLHEFARSWYAGSRFCSVKSLLQPVNLLTLCIGKTTSDQAAGIGMKGRSAEYSNHGKRLIGHAA